MELIDVLVGRSFVLERLGSGSSFPWFDNQRIIDVPRSLQEGQVVRLQ